MKDQIKTLALHSENFTMHTITKPMKNTQSGEDISLYASLNH